MAEGKEKATAAVRTGYIRVERQKLDGGGARDMMDSYVILPVWIDNILKRTKETIYRED